MEVRRFDRVMHEELVRWCSRHMGSLDDGVLHYLDNDGLNVWRLLDPVISSLPDQGVEGAHPLPPKPIRPPSARPRLQVNLRARRSASRRRQRKKEGP